jgi:hypothetical protein
MDGLKSAGLLKMENMMDRKKNPIVADLGTIINFSPKVDLIESIIRQLGVDYQGNPGQAILFTYNSRRGLRQPLRRSYAAGGRSQHPKMYSALSHRINPQIKLDLKFPVSQALVCARLWDHPATVQEVNVLLSPNSESAC